MIQKQAAIPVLLTALIFFPAGLTVGRITADTARSPVAENIPDDHSEVTTHTHEAVNVPAENAPRISNLSIEKDAKSGWNIRFDTQNFIFAPDNASSAHMSGEGHAHLYINGDKVTRLYSNYYYLDHVDEGKHTVRVTLNTNDHKDYAVDGAVAAAETTFVDLHHSEDSPIKDDSHADDHSHDGSDNEHNHD